MRVTGSLAGTVVILNGPPHAGKTAIAKQVQATSDAPFHALGLDVLFHRMVPASVAAAGLVAPPDRRYLRALHAAIAGMARSGCNVIVDHTLHRRGWLEELQLFLAGLDLVLVEVRCDPDTLARREADSGLRPEGAALDLAMRMVQGLPTQLTLDAGTESPAACAGQLLDYLAHRPMGLEPRARWVSRALPRSAPRPGHVIQVCGASSAGKSTVCQAVQDGAPDLTVQFGLDHLIDVMAARFLDLPLHADQVANYQPSPEGVLGDTLVPPGPSPENPTDHIIQQFGPAARIAVSGIYGGVAAIAQAGLNVVSDQTFIFRDFYDECAALFEGLPTLWVYACPDLEVLEAHERARGDRLPGFAVSQWKQMFKEFPWQVKIDTGHLTPEEEVRRILDWLEP